MSTTSIVLIIVGMLIYSGFVIFHGTRSFKSTSDSAEKFFTADRGINPFILMCTTAISVFSALAFYGVPAALYRYGIGYYSNTGGMVAGLMFVVMGYRLWLLGREYGFTTPVDFLRNRFYSDSFGLIVSLVLMLFIVPYVAMQLVTIGDAVVVTTEGVVPYFIAVAVGTIVVSLHIIGGGMGVSSVDGYFPHYLRLRHLNCPDCVFHYSLFPRRRLRAGGTDDAGKRYV